MNTEMIREIFKLLKEAAEEGCAYAQTGLGCRYYHGIGVAKNYAAAVSLYRLAAEQGNALAQNNLGFCYGKGRGVVQDYKKAAEWHRKAAEQGNAVAQYNLNKLKNEAKNE